MEIESNDGDKFEPAGDAGAPTGASGALPPVPTVDDFKVLADSCAALNNAQILTAGVLGGIDREFLHKIYDMTLGMDGKRRAEFSNQLKVFLNSVDSISPPGEDHWKGLPVISLSDASAVLRSRDNITIVTILSIKFEPDLLYTMTSSGCRLTYDTYGAKLVTLSNEEMHPRLANALIIRALFYGKSFTRSVVTISPSPNAIGATLLRYISVLGIQGMSSDMLFKHAETFTASMVNEDKLNLANPDPFKIPVSTFMLAQYERLSAIAAERLHALSTWGAYEKHLKGKPVVEYPLAEFKTDRQFRAVVGDVCKDFVYKSSALANAVNTIRKWSLPIATLATLFRSYAVGHSKTNRWLHLLLLYNVQCSSAVIDDECTLGSIQKSVSQITVARLIPPLEETYLKLKKEDIPPTEADGDIYIDPSKVEDVEDLAEVRRDSPQEFAKQYKDLLTPAQRAAYASIEAKLNAAPEPPLEGFTVIFSDAYRPPTAIPPGSLSQGLYTEDSWSWEAQKPLYTAYNKLLNETQGLILVAKFHPLQTTVKSKEANFKAGNIDYAWMSKVFPGCFFRPFFATRHHNGEMIIAIVAPVTQIALVKHANKKVVAFGQTLRPINPVPGAIGLTQMVADRMRVSNALRNLALSSGLPHLNVEHSADNFAMFMMCDNKKVHVPSSDFAPATEEDLEIARKAAEKKAEDRKKDKAARKLQPKGAVSKDAQFATILSTMKQGFN